MNNGARLRVLAVAVTLGTLGGGALPGMAQEAVCLWVEPGKSIQAAIDVAPPGSTVCLPDGLWVENIRIAKPLTLRGRGAEHSVIQAKSPVAPILWVYGERKGIPITVVVEGVTLVGQASAALGSNFGVYATGAVYLMVRSCAVRDARTGLWLTGETRALITTTEISVQNLETLVLKGACGIVVSGTAQATIVDTAIAGRELTFGILVEEHAQVAVERAIVTQSEFGIYIHDQAQAMVTDTQITQQSDSGIVVRGAAQAIVAHSSVSGCVTGVVFRGEAQARLSRSVLVSNGEGVVIMESASVVLSENRITENKGYGVLVPPADHPRVWFRGLVAGGNNVIPGPDELGGNLLGAVLLEELSFLMTKEGGAWPRR